MVLGHGVASLAGIQPHQCFGVAQQARIFLRLKADIVSPNDTIFISLQLRCASASVPARKLLGVLQRGSDKCLGCGDVDWLFISVHINWDTQVGENVFGMIFLS